MPITQHDVEEIFKEIDTFVVRQLQSILRFQHQPLSGPKALLKTRVQERVREIIRRNDHGAFSSLQAHIRSLDSQLQPPPVSQTGSTASFNHVPHLGGSQIPSWGAKPLTNVMSKTNHGFGPNHQSSTLSGCLRVNSTPFNTMLEPLSAMHELKSAESSKEAIDIKLRVKGDVLERISHDRHLKIMLYCCPFENNVASPHVAFPTSVEVRVNGKQVQANLRGLKNRPGSTRPADITSYLDLRSGVENTVLTSYALSPKRHLMQIILSRQYTAQDLFLKLSAGSVISKESVLREIQEKTSDAEIQATSSKMSLKCPLSTLRIDVPCRSTLCTHNRCFDALSFLQLQEQAPLWSCPICHKTIPFQVLAIDKYVQDILNKTAKDVDQVLVEPDGHWSLTSGNEAMGRNAAPMNGKAPVGQPISINLDDDDEENTANGSTSITRVVPIAQPPQAPITTSAKRPQNAVVDLTLDSDDDEAETDKKRQKLNPAYEFSRDDMPTFSRDPFASFLNPG